LQRRAYTPVARIREELSHFLANDPALDYITFSGAGEPLLHSHIEEIVSFLKHDFPQYKIALLTNGTLLSVPNIVEEIQEIDVVKVSVDALSEDIFTKINRPHAEVNIARMIDGLISFAEARKNQLWIEIFLIPGVNDTTAEMGSIKKVLEQAHPDRIHLNTIDRPGTEKWIPTADEKTLQRVSDILGTVCRVEQPYTRSRQKKDSENFRQLLLSTIKRRPCTVDDISKILGMHISEIKIQLESLDKKGVIEKREMPRGLFYTMK